MNWLKRFRKTDVSSILLTGGDGRTINSPIIVDVRSNVVEFPAISSLMLRLHGTKDRDWSIIEEQLEKNDQGEFLVLNIRSKNEGFCQYYFNLDRISYKVEKLLLFIKFSKKCRDIHQANLSNGLYFCGFIPAECPLCLRIGVSPVYLTPKPTFSPVYVICMHCNIQVDWAEPFALVASVPEMIRSNVNIEQIIPDWLNRIDEFKVDDAIRKYLASCLKMRDKMRETIMPLQYGEDKETKTIVDSARGMAEAGSGLVPIHQLNEEHEKLHDQRSNYREVEESDVKREIEAIMEGIDQVYSKLPSDEDLKMLREEKRYVMLIETIKSYLF